MRKALCVLAAASALLTFNSSAHADVHIWTGAGTNNNFATPANWNNGVPADGDSVIFARGPRNTASGTNNSEYTLTGIQFQPEPTDNLAFTFSIGNDSILTLQGDVIDLSGNAKLAGPGPYTSIIPVATTTISGGTLKFEGTGDDRRRIDVATNSRLHISSKLDGDYFIKTGGGFLTLSGDNRSGSITGIDLQEGYLKFDHTFAHIPELVIGSNATYLSTSGAAYTFSSITGSGTIANSSATHAHQLYINNTEDFVFSGALIDQVPGVTAVAALGLVKNGAGKMTLTGTNLTLSHDININEGTFALNGIDADHKAVIGNAKSFQLNRATLEIGTFGAISKTITVNNTPDPESPTPIRANIINAGDIGAALTGNSTAISVSANARLDLENDSIIHRSISSAANSTLNVLNRGTIRAVDNGTSISVSGGTATITNHGNITGEISAINDATVTIESYGTLGAGIKAQTGSNVAVAQHAASTVTGNFGVTYSANTGGSTLYLTKGIFDHRGPTGGTLDFGVGQASTLHIGSEAHFTVSKTLQLTTGSLLKIDQGGQVISEANLIFGTGISTTIELTLTDTAAIHSTGVRYQNANVDFKLSLGVTADIGDALFILSRTGGATGVMGSTSVNGQLLGNDAEFKLSYLSSEYTFRLDYVSTGITATVLDVQAIPEPSTWLLLGSSMVTLAFLRQRRRRALYAPTR